MGIRLPGVIQAKQILRQSLLTASSAASNAINVPKGYLAVYVGESQKRQFLVPVSYLNQPIFQELLHGAEEEYGFDHPMGALTIPCPENTFLDITSHLSSL
ncbi:auxin-induced protein X10A-like [Cornus florida]|uniref:auxin-induced protein X10A-like n=1 Tax=Cornus florida TaxID=4283 RepID=UPI0028A082DB|nr:auxin-induced protein X10A-like [Cornus florida]